MGSGCYAVALSTVIRVVMPNRIDLQVKNTANLSNVVD